MICIVTLLLFVFGSLRQVFSVDNCFLVRFSIVVKRHYDHGNSYKGRDLVRAGLQQVQRFSPLSSWWEEFYIWIGRQQEE